MKLIICLTGMPGAGKTTIAEGLKSKGFDKITMGDAVREEATRRKIDPTGANLGKIMIELREKNGQGAVAELIKDVIQNSKSDVILVDGVRSLAEVNVLKKIGTVKVLAIHASGDTRYKFLTGRGRSDAPSDREDFTKRDSREIGVGMSESIALADETISNNNMTIQELVDTAYRVIKGWMN
ncbi:AAA family ATPase [Candidatus Nitrosotalea okcheonensis]|uniref:AAA family ATPase n=1 Tax=Candidatus Nitrosotalea okcheonensis TaxID=1903276 RepID=UPI0037441CF6